MADRFDYWVHGIALVHEDDTHPGLELQVLRRGWGTEVQQRSGTGGAWFHFPIPTPTYLDNDRVNYRAAAVRGEVSHLTTVMAVNIWHGGHPISQVGSADASRPNDPPSLDIRGRSLDHHVNLSAASNVGDPLNICVFVHFELGGKITFTGAGVHFDEETY